MKKTFLLAICAVGFTFALSSCTKDYTCTCTAVDSSGTIGTVTASTVYTDVKKGDAEDLCSANESIIGTITTTCTLD